MEDLPSGFMAALAGLSIRSIVAELMASKLGACFGGVVTGNGSEAMEISMLSNDGSMIATSTSLTVVEVIPDPDQDFQRVIAVGVRGLRAATPGLRPGFRALDNCRRALARASFFVSSWRAAIVNPYPIVKEHQSAQLPGRVSRAFAK